MKPKLVYSFAHWQQDWEYILAEQEKLRQGRVQRTLEERLAEETQKRAAAEQAALNAKLELVAAREAATAGTGKEWELEQQMK